MPVGRTSAPSPSQLKALSPEKKILVFSSTRQSFSLKDLLLESDLEMEEIEPALEKLVEKGLLRKNDLAGGKVLYDSPEQEPAPENPPDAVMQEIPPVEIPEVDAQSAEATAAPTDVAPSDVASTGESGTPGESEGPLPDTESTKRRTRIALGVGIPLAILLGLVIVIFVVGPGNIPGLGALFGTRGTPSFTVGEVGASSVYTEKGKAAVTIQAERRHRDRVSGRASKIRHRPSNTDAPCFCIVEMKLRILQKATAPSQLRNVPEIFC